MKVAILSGSVYGTAEEVARHAEKILREAGFQAWHNPRATLADVQAFAPEAFLAVTATTGMGELPDNLQPLYNAIRDQLPAAWRGLPGGVIALGDSGPPRDLAVARHGAPRHPTRLRNHYRAPDDRGRVAAHR